MILRRSSRTDPRLVLGSALAFALPLSANLAALAQEPSQAPSAQVPAAQAPTGKAPTGQAPTGQAPVAQVPSPPVVPAPAIAPKTDPGVLKQHDQELNAARAQQRQTAETQAKLKLEIEAISADRTAFNQQLIDTAARVRDVEANIDAAQARLKPLDEREHVFQTSLDERRTVI